MLASLLLMVPVQATPTLSEHPWSVADFRVEQSTPVLDGAPFGDAGPYVRLEGQVVFHFDPADPRCAQVVDLEFAPRTLDGHVEAIADVMILHPETAPADDSIALFEVSNRGGKASLRYFQFGQGGADPQTAADFGDGLLMERGVTIVWLGWQADVPERNGNLRFQAPRAHNLDGSPIQGLVRADWNLQEDQTRLPLSHRGHIPYLPADGTEAGATLTVRPSRDARRKAVPRQDWSFDDAVITGSFSGNHIYELVYTASDPWVLGLGPAAVAQFAGWLKDPNHCSFAVEHTVAVGISQTGRFLRHFLYQGFNDLGEGQRAFDGMCILTAGAGRGSFNHRFGQPSRDAHQNSAFLYPTDIFPFTSRTQQDPVPKRSDGLFARALATDTVPKVFQINTGYEYWGRAAALIHTSIDGSADVAPLPDERLYHIRGAQHFPVGWPKGAQAEALKAAESTPILRGSPVDNLVVYRALLSALFDWVVLDLEPPPSRIPTIAKGTLVPLAEYRLPEVRGLIAPTVAETAYRTHYGQNWMLGIVGNQPPVLGPQFPTLVPQVDLRGNEISGVPTLETAVDLGTYLPYHLGPARPDGTQALTDFYGSFLPLPPDDATAERWGDGRYSLDFYFQGNRSLYHALVDINLDAILADRWLLPRDRERMVQEALRRWDVMMKE